MYFNRSGRTLTVESVRLADAHGLVMHRALVYLMSRDENPLPYERPWSQIGQGVPEPAWSRHQARPRQGGTRRGGRQCLPGRSRRLGRVARRRLGNRRDHQVPSGRPDILGQVLHGICDRPADRETILPIPDENHPGRLQN
jgi:hypothetical protein